MTECTITNCQFNRNGLCLDDCLRNQYKQTGCLLYLGVNFTDYPRDEQCKFCIDRWGCRYKENNICPREGEK